MTRGKAADLVPLPPPEPAAAGAIIGVELLEPTHGPLLQGELVPFRFALTNTSSDVLILRELYLEGADSQVVRFSLSGYGTVSFDESKAAYFYDSTQQQTTPRVFEHGVVLPGESRRIELVDRLIESRQVLVLRYLVMPMDQFRRVAYVPIDVGGRKQTFQHLETLPPDHLKPRSIPEGPIVERPVILSEELSPDKVLTLEQKHTRTIPLRALPGTADQAREIAGFPGRITYWSWARGWVVLGGRYSVLVTAEGKRILPAVDPQVFRDIDSGKVRLRVKLGGAGELFKGRFAVRQGDGIYTFGEFIDVPAERLWEFFDLAGAEQLAIVREYYLFDAYYYLLTPAP